MTRTKPISVAIVGVGEIARNQHIPAIAASDEFNLVAVVNREAPIENVPNYECIDHMIAKEQDIGAIALCTPPQVRFDLAQRALQADWHVLLEKPPGATLSEVTTLDKLARSEGLTLLASWHSRHASAVEKAKAWLQGRKIHGVDVIWKEDVRRWHPGQDWIWRSGGTGVFDPGINALSILTHILPEDFHLMQSDLDFPENCETPIAARLLFSDTTGVQIRAEFDWRREGPQTWDILVTTDDGYMRLSAGGCVLHVDDALLYEAPEAEYASLYDHFATLIADGRSDVDLSPLRHVADAFMIGKRHNVEPFID